MGQPDTRQTHELEPYGNGCSIGGCRCAVAVHRDRSYLRVDPGQAIGVRHRMLTPERRRQVEEWLAETGELYVDIYVPHSAGGGTPYFVRSVDEIDELMVEPKWPELVVTVFRRLQYPLRGVADDNLLAEALQQIADGDWFHFVSLEDYYPSPCVWCGSGNTHAELRQEFSEVVGKRIGIGKSPSDEDNSSSNSKEVLVVRRHRPAEER